jgi:hypothetical protein
MTAVPGLFTRNEGGGVRVRLHRRLRLTLADLCDQLEHLLTTEHASSDPALARLSPAAYPDDPIQELEFERLVGDELTAGRLSSLRAMRESVNEPFLDEELGLAWLRTLNDLRLVLGTRLGVTEDDQLEDDGPLATGFDLYVLLGHVQQELLFAIDPDAGEPGDVDLE